MLREDWGRRNGRKKSSFFLSFLIPSSFYFFSLNHSVSPPFFYKGTLVRVARERARYSYKCTE
jgi:hypothetical protein